MFYTTEYSACLACVKQYPGISLGLGYVGATAVFSNVLWLHALRTASSVAFVAIANPMARLLDYQLRSVFQIKVTPLLQTPG